MYGRNAWLITQLQLSNKVYKSKQSYATVEADSWVYLTAHPCTGRRNILADRGGKEMPKQGERAGHGSS